MDYVKDLHERHQRLVKLCLSFVVCHKDFSGCPFTYTRKYVLLRRLLTLSVRLRRYQHIQSF